MATKSVTHYNDAGTVALLVTAALIVVGLGWDIHRRRTRLARSSYDRLLALAPGRVVRAGQQLQERHRVERLGAEHAGPFQVPLSISSSATIGLTAVCHTTACEPYSRIDHSLSTT